MTADLLKRVLLFVVLCVVQALVLNHIHLFNCATPLLYVYFILRFNRNEPKWAIMLWCFFLGLVSDTFTNTPGMAAASMTFVGMIQPYLLELIIAKDSADDLKPSLHTMGIHVYMRYSIAIVLLYCLVFYSIEAFNFFNWVYLLECAGGSAVVTLLLIFAIESVRKK
jgi:rod shape-determining protein MreD